MSRAVILSAVRTPVGRYGGALVADLEVSRGDGGAERVRPFERDEILTRLERWFFGHAAS